MKKIIPPFKTQTIFAGLILSWLVEFIPVFTFLDEHWNRFFYAIIALSITLRIENNINKKKFRNGLRRFIKDLKTIRINFEDKKTNYEVKPEVIQAIMKSTVLQIAEVLEQKDNLGKEFRRDLYEESGNLHCITCNRNHLSDMYSKCQICKVPSRFWKGVQN